MLCSGPASKAAGPARCSVQGVFLVCEIVANKRFATADIGVLMFSLKVAGFMVSLFRLTQYLGGVGGVGAGWRQPQGGEGESVLWCFWELLISLLM